MLGAAAFFLACLALFLYVAGLGWWTLPVVALAAAGLFLVADITGRADYDESLDQ